MKNEPNILMEDRSNFEELIDALIVGPDSCCWTQSAKQIVAGVLRATQKAKRESGGATGGEEKE